MYKTFTRPSVGLLLVTCALGVSSRDAAAQASVCHTIKPGETASSVAQRLTGHADSHHQPWFQIVDPVSSMMVPKDRYDRIVAGWQACVPATHHTQSVPGSMPTGTIDPPTMAMLSDLVASIAGQLRLIAAQALRNRSAGLAYLGMAAVALGAAIGLVWYVIERFLTARRARLREMQVFCDAFVRDFEQPLVIAGVAARPIRARLRWSPGYRRLDILLAPGAGRRYPNLDDHRMNVEYDVDRIVRQLRHHPFVPKPLHTEGHWVVIPFRFEPGPKTGAFI